jgi:hypothetical protein
MYPPWNTVDVSHYLTYDWDMWSKPVLINSIFNFASMALIHVSSAGNLPAPEIFLEFWKEPKVIKYQIVLIRSVWYSSAIVMTFFCTKLEIQHDIYRHTGMVKYVCLLLFWWWCLKVGTGHPSGQEKLSPLLYSTTC